MAKAVPVTKIKFNPDEGIERLYQRGVLPYGGGISLDGKVVFAQSREDVERRITKYRALKK
jgi:hypothetical protein